MQVYLIVYDKTSQIDLFSKGIRMSENNNKDDFFEEITISDEVQTPPKKASKDEEFITIDPSEEQAPE